MAPSSYKPLMLRSWFGSVHRLNRDVCTVKHKLLAKLDFTGLPQHGVKICVAAFELGEALKRTSFCPLASLVNA